MPDEIKQPEVKAKSDFNPGASKPIFSWQSPEFIRYTKDWKWFTTLSAVALVLAGVFYWQKQTSGAIMVIVAAVVLGIMSEIKPKLVKCAVYREGVVVDDKVYNFGQFKSFSISGRDIPKLRLQMAGRFAGQVVMPMPEQDIEQVRLFVGKMMPEVEQGEDLVDTINSIFKL